MSIRYDHPRSDWTSKATAAHRFTTKVLGAYLHWPGTTENSLQGESTAQIAELAGKYRDGGGDEQALADALTPEQAAALEA